MLKVAGGGITGSLVYQGTWDASTNTPTLTSSVGTQGYYYVVSVAGSTNLNGITDWQVNDWAVFNGSVWQKVDNTDAVASFSAGTTGLTPASATTGAITLAGTLAVANGGTGQTSYTDGQLLIGNTTGNTLAKSTLTAGSGVTITNGSGSITISATGSGGTVTAVTGTSPVASSGGTTPAISLNSAYGDTLNPYGSKTANFVLAAPNGSAGVPTFRAIVAADIPTLNQNTTGTASNVTGVVAAANGGTGISSYAVGDLIYASGTTTLSKLADVATGNAVISGGVGVAPSWGKIGLTTHVSGTLPIANGGTALTTTPTNGQLLIGNGTNYTLATLTAGTAIGVTNASGSITVNNTGVTSAVAGSGISVSGATGAVTITNNGVTSLTAGTGISVNTTTLAVTVTATGTYFFSTKTSAYTLTATDSIVLANASTGAFSITLPSSSGISGKVYTIKKTDSSANAVTIATTALQLIDGQSTYSLANQYTGVSVVADGANWYIVSAIPGRNGTAGTF